MKGQSASRLRILPRVFLKFGNFDYDSLCVQIFVLQKTKKVLKNSFLLYPRTIYTYQLIPLISHNDPDGHRPMTAISAHHSLLAPSQTCFIFCIIPTYKCSKWLEMRILPAKSLLIGLFKCIGTLSFFFIF